jgi:hypothetical protein
MMAGSCAVPATLPGVRRSLLLVLFAAVALNSCASDDEPLDAQSILDRGFTTGMRSADLAIEAELELKGSSSFGDPVRIQAKGPYISAKDRLPSADIELEVGSEGNGQTVSTGLLTTGHRAFLKFQDVYYEQPPAQVRRTNRLLRERRGSQGSLSELGLDPRGWISDARNEGEADVAGVETMHVSGSVDMRRLMRDLNSFLRRSASALGGATGAKPAPLTPVQVSAIADAVENPSFDVYVGKKDGIIRRVSGRIDFEVPKVKRAGLGGIDSGSIRFSVEFTDVNGDQKVEAPAGARPLSALTRSLGGGSLLEGLAGDRQAPSPTNPPPETPVPGSNDDASPGTDDFKAYSDCLDEARPEDTEALQRCADLLRP